MQFWEDLFTFATSLYEINTKTDWRMDLLYQIILLNLLLNTLFLERIFFNGEAGCSLTTSSVGLGPK